MKPLSSAQLAECERRIRTWTTYTHTPGHELIRGPYGVAVIIPVRSDEGGWYLACWGHDRGAGGHFSQHADAFDAAQRFTGTTGQQLSLL